ncbi:hypothetical protein NDU88_003261 [Pleurodeles waltl]|uniref:Uncharacterized protein n=1 Tax=Pleurodeles waltl TaxID=8319 RepID=A0AAV7MU32_PLEWA|nr:hypothetical protein NDU88_003261 [Pleurodeles waltl]
MFTIESRPIGDPWTHTGSRAGTWNLRTSAAVLLTLFQGNQRDTCHAISHCENKGNYLVGQRKEYKSSSKSMPRSPCHQVFKKEVDFSVGN